MWEKLENTFDKSISTVAVLFFVAGSLFYTFQIIWRMIFSESFFWIDGLVSYLFTLAALFGAALAVRQHENIKIDILRKYAHVPIVRILVNGFGLLVTVLLVGVFYFHTVERYEGRGQSSFGVAEWVLNLPYLFLFLGAGVFYLGHFMRSIMALKNPKSDSPANYPIV